MHRFILLFLASLVLLAACQKGPQQTEGNTADVKRYPLKGKIISVDKAAKKVKIQHQAIEGYMDAMTMDFPVREDFILNDLTAGSDIKADLVVGKDSFWLENISVTAAADPSKPAPPVNESFAHYSKEVPNFQLTNQDGEQLSLNDFRGKALAITFIYRECPLPDYCIKMSRNFSDLALELQNDNLFKDKIRLLSISFDPARDTPEKLRSYGLGYLGTGAKPDFTVWQLAVGKDKEIRRIADFFGLQYEVDPNDNTKINHSLVTAVITPDGKISKIYSGNDWTTAELLRALKDTLDA